MNVLGIETSCDETAAAVVRDGFDVLSNAVYTQIARHRPYGGVVPEIASRAHVEVLPSILRAALEDAKVGWDDIDAIAVTRGPGLASSLLVGLAAARTLSIRFEKPLVGVNHLKGHLHSVFLGDGAPRPEPGRPVLVLLVSGGHSCMVRYAADGEPALLGQTIDDAAGEALDKGAKLLGLGYPGGPEIEKAAAGGDPRAVAFSSGIRLKDTARTGGLSPDYCFSFSGLKTALLYHVRGLPSPPAGSALADICASYQEAVFAALISRVHRALQAEPYAAFACVGGVARNKRLRAMLEEVAADRGVPLWLAAPQYCTDNAAMIAGWAGWAARCRGGFAGLPAGLDPEPALPVAE